MRVCIAALLLVPALSMRLHANDKQDRPFDSLTVDLGQVPDFALTERSGRVVRRDDLKGHVWVAAFIYTCCEGGCSTLSKNLSALQNRLADCENVRLVSFSVHPEQDTPEVLQKYATDLGADPQRWWFLTGDKPAIYSLIEKGFH